MIVAISGPPGSGKTTVAERFARAHGYEMISAGALFRERAKDYGMSLVKFGRYAEAHPDVDRALDEEIVQRVRKSAGTGKDVVVDGRLQPWLLEKHRVPCLKVLIDASLDRLGVCNRLNLLLAHRDVAFLGDLLAFLAERGFDVRGTERVGAGAARLDVRLGHEWANDAARIKTVTVDVVDSLEEAVRLANEETSGLAAGIVTEDRDAAERFLDGYRGTAAFWHAPTRFTDGFELTGAPETGINVDWTPGPRGPVTYRDLWLRQYRIIGDGTQRR